MLSHEVSPNPFSFILALLIPSRIQGENNYPWHISVRFGNLWTCTCKPSLLSWHRLYPSLGSWNQKCIRQDPVTKVLMVLVPYWMNCFIWGQLKSILLLDKEKRILASILWTFYDEICLSSLISTFLWLEKFKIWALSNQLLTLNLNFLVKIHNHVKNIADTWLNQIQVLYQKLPSKMLFMWYDKFINISG